MNVDQENACDLKERYDVEASNTQKYEWNGEVRLDMHHPPISYDAETGKSLKGDCAFESSFFEWKISQICFPILDHGKA